MITELYLRAREGFAQALQLSQYLGRGGPGSGVSPAALKYRCADCGAFPDDYMVEPEIWAEAGFATPKGFCCLACLEARLRRPLTLSDFSGCAANKTLLFGVMLGSRGSRTPKHPGQYEPAEPVTLLDRWKAKHKPLRACGVKPWPTS